MFGMADSPCSFSAIGGSKKQLKDAIATGVEEKLEDRKEVVKVLQSIVDLYDEPGTNTIIQANITVHYNKDKCVYFDVDVCTKEGTYSG